jgi:mRNA-degrading endonuclease RelE of RelBE toxin-antitoxin system
LEFIETSQFSRLREKYLDDARFNLLQLYLMESPDAGDVIQGSGGVRKLRWGTKGRGKQGGLRVVYYWITRDDQILFLTLYDKSEAKDLSRDAIRAMRQLINPPS